MPSLDQPKQIISLIALLLFISLFFACTPGTEIPSMEPLAYPSLTSPPTKLPSATVTKSRSTHTPTIITETPEDSLSTPQPSNTPTPDLRLDPEDWQSWPIVPTVSALARDIYHRGLAVGNDPNRFSKVGDCQNITTYFLAIFDHPNRYHLGPDYDYLQEAINHFNGSFSRESIAVAGGMNVASVLSPYWADKDQCNSNESPLHCELRLHQPSIVLISMEETWGRNNKVENYEKYLRQIIETVIEAGAVPIMTTKADNKEGGHLVNQTIARLAHEYDIPLWNYWLAVQPLPNHGLLEDGFHLTHGLNFYHDERNLRYAWPMRNLTALQVINAVWRQASNNFP
jgi:hypothetical protein